MDRRARSKSRNRKNASEKSPKNKKVKDSSPATKSVGRGRPRKKVEDKDDKKRKASQSRSRSRSVSVQRKRTKSKSRASIKKKSSTEDLPSVVLRDIVKSKPLSSKLDDVIRRSMSREVEGDNLRRSARFSERISLIKKEQWTESTVSSNNVLKPISKKIEFGGWAGALVHIVVFFLIVGGTILGCTKDQCELKPFHIPRNWRVYLNLQSSIGFVSFVLLQTVLSILPIGRVVKSIDGNSSYRGNGFLALILTALFLGAGWYVKQPVTSIYEKWIPTAVAAYITSWVISIGLYIKGRRAPVPGLNPYGNSGNLIYDLVAGREINPTLFGLINVKIVLFRVCVIGTILVDSMLLLKGYEVRKELSPTLVTLVVLKSLYCLDALWFEEAFSSTFEVQYEGTGLLATQGYLLYPFFSAVLTRFVLQQRVQMPTYSLAISVIVYLVGYSLYRASNLQKATFRKNPLDPAISHLQTINTSRGKKLLVSGWWGKVKHPNYLGDIILTWAFTTTVGFTHAIPYIVPLITTVFLLHRAARDDKRCSDRYLGAWLEYSKRVPYRICPKIY